MKGAGTIVYYVSAHGYGHGVRTSDVLGELCALSPETRVLPVTGLPAEFWRSRFPRRTGEPRAASFDVGMIQRDAITVDPEQTYEAVRELYARRGALIEQECRFLAETGADLVVSDIPAIPLEAAARAGVDGVAVGNFGWDWIYAELAGGDTRWDWIIAAIEAGYRAARMLYRLPFAEPMRAFTRQMEIPLLARAGTARRERLAALTGADPGREWALLSFVSVNWDAGVVKRVAALRDVEFFTVRPLEWAGSGIHAVDRTDVSYSDTLASMDWVISKPGFGLVSECLANAKPLLYVDRDHFAEYPILERAIRRYLRSAHIPQREFYAGNLEPYLARLRCADVPAENMPGGGARLLAGELLKRVAS